MALIWPLTSIRTPIPECVVYMSCYLTTSIISNRSHFLLPGYCGDLCVQQIRSQRLMADLIAICAIHRSYMGHIWAIQKLCTHHVQPTVQATDGPCQISRERGSQPKAAVCPFSSYIVTMVHLRLVL